MALNQPEFSPGSCEGPLSGSQQAAGHLAPYREIWQNTEQC
jgi:hypothetical protein